MTTSGVRTEKDSMGVEMSLSLSLKAASICIWKKALSQSSRLQKTPGGDLSNAFIVGFKTKKKEKETV